MFDDDLTLKTSSETFPRNLELLSVAELETYITELKSEIGRVEQDIEKKKASQDAASAFFK